MMNLGMDTFLEYGLGGLELFVLLRYVFGFEYRGRKYIAGAVISAITLAALSPVLLKMGLLQVGSDYYIQKSSLLYFLGEAAILLLVFRKLRVGHFLCLYEMQRIAITFLYTIGELLMKESLSTMMSELVLILLIGILCVIFRGKRDSVQNGLRAIRYYQFWIFTILLAVPSHYQAVSGDTVQILQNVQSELILRGRGAAVLMAAFLVLLIMYEAQNQKLLREQRENHQCVKLQVEQYKFLNQRQKELRAFRHDYKAHITAMENMLDEGQTTQLRDYLQDIIGQTRELQYLSVNNLVGDAVLNQYYCLGEKEGVHVSAAGRFPQGFPVSNSDLCIILSNTVKNAYEAAAKCSEPRYVKVTIKAYEEKNVFIIIENPVDVMPEIVDGKLQIHTDLEGEHGFGLYNVEKALRRNNGKISFRGIEKKDGKREIVTEIEV